MVEIICSIIATIGVIWVGYIGIRKANREGWEKMANTLTTSLAVLETKQEELTREVRLHNNFASKIPLLEADISRQEQEINNLKKEVKDLERALNKMGGV